MTKEQAIFKAQQVANDYGQPILVYSDSIGNAEDSRGPWGFCPPAVADLLAKYRDKKQDNLIYPNEKRDFVRTDFIPETFVVPVEILCQVEENRKAGRAERRNDVLDSLGTAIRLP